MIFLKSISIEFIADCTHLIGVDAFAMSGTNSHLGTHLNPVGAGVGASPTLLQQHVFTVMFKILFVSSNSQGAFFPKFDG